MTEMRDITTYSVKPFSLRGSVIRQMSCNFFSLSGLQCILAKPQKKSIL